MLPGDLKHDPAAGFDLVNCEPQVEKDQQHDFNGGCYPGFPLQVHLHGEQVPVDLVHGVVGAASSPRRLMWMISPAGSSRRPSGQHLRRAFRCGGAPDRLAERSPGSEHE